MRSDRDDRVTLESDLRKALAKNQIKVLYQPIIYLPTEELAGFEALVRWEHPKRGLMSPVDFIPIAEQSDLIVRLGSHVLLRAAHEAARWQRELPREERPLFVSVNISSRQIFRQNLIQEIRHILGRNIVPKGSLRLEITESLVMENPEQATEILEWLRGAGAELALDDFGTGYSSLAYLQRFPFDTIKIDRALVQASGESGGAGSAIVRSIVALGHELGKSVVAGRSRDARGRRLPALDQLPVRAGLLLRRADVGSRRAAALEDGAHGRA
ncbi:MAG: EAL domain-containing protein [Hyphomicrobium sp.]|nr:EAL domain-containing protein [Hyphomicrobium sp.]